MICWLSEEHFHGVESDDDSYDDGDGSEHCYLLVSRSFLGIPGRLGNPFSVVDYYLVTVIIAPDDMVSVLDVLTYQFIFNDPISPVKTSSSTVSMVETSTR